MSASEFSGPEEPAQVPEYRCILNPGAKQHPDWHARAFQALVTFVKRNPGKRFLMEEFRSSLRPDDPLPFEPRNWGHITRAAKQAKLIKRVGHRNARSSNLSPKPEWEALQ